MPKKPMPVVKEVNGESGATQAVDDLFTLRAKKELLTFNLELRDFVRDNASSAHNFVIALKEMERAGGIQNIKSLDAFIENLELLKFKGLEDGEATELLESLVGKVEELVNLQEKVLSSSKADKEEEITREKRREQRDELKEKRRKLGIYRKTADKQKASRKAAEQDDDDDDEEMEDDGPKSRVLGGLKGIFGKVGEHISEEERSNVGLSLLSVLSPGLAPIVHEIGADKIFSAGAGAGKAATGSGRKVVRRKGPSR